MAVSERLNSRAISNRRSRVFVDSSVVLFMTSKTVAAVAAPKVCILGASLDVSNRGVLALGASLATLIDRTWAGAEITFHYSHSCGGSRVLAIGGRDLEVQVRNCRMSPRSVPAEHIGTILLLAFLHRLGIKEPARRNEWLQSLLNADFIADIRGGDSFSDIYGLGRYFSGCLPLFSVLLLGRRYVMLPQTYGPLRRALSRWFARIQLRGAALLLTRDQNCRSTVEALTGRVPRFCPDVAFTLEPARPARLSIEPAGLDLNGDRLLVGINISGLLYTGGYTGRNMFGLRSFYPELASALVDRLLACTSAQILLIPHEFGSEREVEACGEIFEYARTRYPGRVFMLSGALNEREVKWVIGRTDFFVGSRMHACIAGLSQCVPSVGLAYSDKFLGVFESAGVAEAIVDLRHMEGEAVVEEVLTRFSRRVELKQTLEAIMPPVVASVFSTFAELAESNRNG